MNISSITKRLIKPYTRYTILFRNLSKVVNGKFSFLYQDKTQKRKLTVPTFSIRFRSICQTSTRESWNILAKSFTRLIPKIGVTNLHKSNKQYNEPIARCPGYSGVSFKNVSAHVNSWRWYASNKNPTDMGGFKGRLDRLGSINDYLFNQEKKPRSLEEIKRMLKEKSLLKESADKDKKT